MEFTPLKIPGSYLIKPTPITDERGFFARSWCQEEFRKRGLSDRLVQCNISFNLKQGTLRGMHYQIAPHAEAKLVRCTQGAIYDAIVDLRAESPTYKQWLAVELTAENHLMLYIPEGVAHGFQSLIDNTEVFYQMSEFYHPQSARGILWNDPEIGIDWHFSTPIISDKDKSYPTLKELGK